MNDQEKKEIIETNNKNASLMDSALEYFQSNDNPSQEEFVEMMIAINPDLNKKAMKGTQKVAHFRHTGKRL